MHELVLALVTMLLIKATFSLSAVGMSSLSNGSVCFSTGILSPVSNASSHSKLATSVSRRSTNRGYNKEKVIAVTRHRKR